jgi:integrase
MHQKHGAYYLVRKNKWTRLAGNLHDSLIEYARLTAGPDKAAFAELVTNALADMKLTIAASTYKNYCSCSRRVLDAFQEFTPQQVKPHHIARFLDDNKETPSMANLLHSFLRNTFKRAVRWGIVESDPTRDIEQFKTAGRDRLITDSEWKAIYANASPTMRCLMDMAYITGQRIGDVMAIKYADISEAGIYVKQQKTKTKRLIQMSPDLMAAIANARALHTSVRAMTLFHKSDGSPLAYNTMYGHWSRACEAAKVENAHFHDIRAGTATDANDAGMDSKGLLGHTSESSHKRYLRSKEVKKVEPMRSRKS